MADWQSEHSSPPPPPPPPPQSLPSAKVTDAPAPPPPAAGVPGGVAGGLSRDLRQGKERMMPDSVARANNGFHELAVPCTTVLPPLPRIETRSRQPHNPTRFLLFPACCYPLLSIPCSLSLSPLSDMAFPRRASLPPPSPLFQSASPPFFALPPTSPSRQTKPASFLHFLPSPFSFYPLPLCFCTGEEKERLPPPSHNKTGRLFEEMGTNNRGGPFFSCPCGGKRPYFPPLPLLRLRDARLPLCRWVVGIC